RSRITCQRIEGSESSSHFMTDFLGFQACDLGVGVAILLRSALSETGEEVASCSLPVDQPRARDAFSATAARTSAFNAFSSILSLSWKSMARLVLPSRLELKRPDGSSSAAPLAKVIFTTFS